MSVSGILICHLIQFCSAPFRTEVQDMPVYAIIWPCSHLSIFLWFSATEDTGTTTLCSHIVSQVVHHEHSSHKAPLRFRSGSPVTAFAGQVTGNTLNSHTYPCESKRLLFQWLWINKLYSSSIMIRHEKNLIADITSLIIYRFKSNTNPGITFVKKNITLSWYSHVHATYKHHNFSSDSKT